MGGDNKSRLKSEPMSRPRMLEPEIKKLNYDDLVKSQESRHSCESRSPELPELTGFPLSRE